MALQTQKVLLCLVQISVGSVLQAVVFEENNKHLLGHPTPLGYRCCCTQDIVPETKCYQDHLIVQVCPGLCCTAII